MEKRFDLLVRYYYRRKTRQKMRGNSRPRKPLWQWSHWGTRKGSMDTDSEGRQMGFGMIWTGIGEDPVQKQRAQKCFEWSPSQVRSPKQANCHLWWKSTFIRHFGRLNYYCETHVSTDLFPLSWVLFSVCPIFVAAPRFVMPSVICQVHVVPEMRLKA